jgi:hypothetical protein
MKEFPTPESARLFRQAAELTKRKIKRDIKFIPSQPRREDQNIEGSAPE